jgi:hypothetical protein
MALCPLYNPMSPLWPYVPMPSAPSTALCLHALCPLYGPLSPLWPYVPSTAICPLYGPLPPLRPSILSTALYPLSGLLSGSTAIFPLYIPMYPLRPSVPHCRKSWRNISFPSDISELFHEDITTNISEKCSL